MIKQSIKMSLSAIASNKMRSLLTMLGIIIGVFTICMIVTLISSISDAILNEFGSSADQYCSVYFQAPEVALSNNNVQQLKADSNLIDKACAFDSRTCTIESKLCREKNLSVCTQMLI